MMIWKAPALLVLSALAIASAQQKQSVQPENGKAVFVLPQGQDSEKRALHIDSLFFETQQGRTYLPAGFSGELKTAGGNGLEHQGNVDGRIVHLSVGREGHNFVVHLNARPDT